MKIEEQVGHPERRKTRRGLVIIVLGSGFLIAMTFGATILDSIIQRRPGPTIQVAQIGPYQLTFQVTPNPPLSTQPATLTFQILPRGSQQPVMNAHLAIATSMETMDMGTTHTEAQVVPNGYYIAHAQFGMSGTWQVVVQVTIPGTKIGQVSFEITAQ